MIKLYVYSRKEFRFMCFVLTPDIIVAAEFGEKRAWDVQNDFCKVNALLKYTISIGECLKKQNRMSRVGLGNVIAEVKWAQIQDFLERSDIFEYQANDEYKLSEKRLKDWERNQDGRTLDECGEFLRQIVLRKAYPTKTLRALSIIQ